MRSVLDSKLAPGSGGSNPSSTPLAQAAPHVVAVVVLVVVVVVIDVVVVTVVVLGQFSPLSVQMVW